MAFDAHTIILARERNRDRHRQRPRQRHNTLVCCAELSVRRAIETINE